MKGREKIVFFLLGVFITSLGYNIHAVYIVESSYPFFKTIEMAEKEINIAVFSFTNLEIAKALVKKSKEGLKVRVIIDKVSKDKKAVRYLIENGVEVRVYDLSTMHAKVMIVDGKVIIGSHNYSYSAFNKNIEVSLFLGELMYLKNLEVKEWFESLWEKAKTI